MYGKSLQKGGFRRKINDLRRKGGLVPFFPSLLPFPEGKEKEKEREGRFPERKVSAISSLRGKEKRIPTSGFIEVSPSSGAFASKDPRRKREGLTWLFRGK